MRKHIGKRHSKKHSKKHSVRLEPTLKHAGHKKVRKSIRRKRG